MLGPNGELAHGEMQAGDGLIMLATPSPDYQSPKHHRQNCESAERWSQVTGVIDGVLVYVDDIDAHFGQAKRAGARILTEIQRDQPGPRYRVEDLEGHRWMFMQR
jgi:PhnB protein